MAPLDPSALGTVGQALLFIGIGIAFGYILESSGFGDSRKLAAQFYFTDMTVLKVMFSAIVVAMVLVAWSVSMGWLNLDEVWINPTYLVPGIVGGLIMGLGFTIGGYCPGTSLVSMATLKKDGAMFALGVAGGIFLFGETVGLFEGFFVSTYMGRFSLPEWLGLETGVVVLGVVLMALFMFWGGEAIRKKVHGEDAPPSRRTRMATLGAAAALVLIAAPLVFISEPTYMEKFDRMGDQQQRLADGAVQIDPGELLASMHDDRLNLVMLDLRDEPAWNRFHLKYAQRADLTGLEEARKRLQELPANTVIVVMSQQEQRATQAWKLLTAMGVPNAYILAGGLDAWRKVYGQDGPGPDSGLALGDRSPAAMPDPHHAPKRDYTPKIKVVLKSAASDGCG